MKYLMRIECRSMDMAGLTTYSRLSKSRGCSVPRVLREEKVLKKDGKEPKAVAIIHCVGSRDENYNKYCSRVCCMYALKFAHLVKDRTSAEVYQFYIDMRSGGKGYEEFYMRILSEGVNVIRGKVAEVVEASGMYNGGRMLLVRCEDTLIGKYREIPVDMVFCAMRWSLDMMHRKWQSCSASAGAPTGSSLSVTRSSIR